MPKRVIVIDDSELAREVIKDDLEDSGFEVIATGSVKEAENIIHSPQRPDIILVDVMMPGIDGGAFCRIMKSREETKNIPIILVSMKEEKDIKVIIELAGADGYLWKANVNSVSLAKIIAKFD